MSIFTVCIIDNSHDLFNKITLLCCYHAALHRIQHSANVTVLYNGVGKGPCFITPTPDLAKFKAKVEEAKVHEDADSECLLAGLHKLIGVWKRRCEREACKVVVNVVMFSLFMPDLSIFDVDVVVDNVTCQRNVHELLCKQLHLCPLYSTDDSLLGLVKLPLLELPDDGQLFDQRIIKLYKFKPKRAELQLMVADQEMPVIVMDHQLLDFRWMDDEGLFYECSEFLYRLSDTSTPLYNNPSNRLDVQSAVVKAHLNSSSVVNLPQVNSQIALKISASQLYSYKPALFNSDYPLIYQFSKVLLAATTQSRQSSSEKDLLFRLLQVILEYCNVKSADLFPHSTDLDTCYKTLQEELLIVAELSATIGEQIKAVFRQDEQGEIASEKKKRKTGYLTIDKGHPPTLPQITDPLLKAYYQQYYFFTDSI